MNEADFQFLKDYADESGPGPQALTVGVVNFGIADQQTIEHVPHKRRVVNIDFTVQEASTAFPLQSAVARLTVIEPVNYLVISPSVRNALIVASIGGDVDFINLGGTFWPVGDYYAYPSGGTLMYRLPTARNYSLAVCVWAAGILTGYVDRARIVYGYLPDFASDGRVPAGVTE